MNTDDDIAALLASCGDERLVRDENGLNRYGCRFSPEPGTLQLGSCTGSTISYPAFEAARRAEVDIRSSRSTDSFYEAIRDGLLRSVISTADPSPDVVLTPSGTDAEFIPLLIALESHPRVTNIIVAPSEVGSGTVRAAQLRHFDRLLPDGSTVEAGSPLDERLMGRVTTVEIPVRDEAGFPLEPDEIDQLASTAVHAAAAAGEAVLLHVVAHSKTGVHAPSLEFVRRATEVLGEQLHVVVDAAQGRISRRGLAEAVRSGWIIMLTGSKFFGGPPFSGAVVVPARLRPLTSSMRCPEGLHPYVTRWQAPESWTAWRASAPDRADPGVLLRWAAGLTEIERYYALEDDVRFGVLRAFEEAAVTALHEAPGLSLEDASPSILDNSEARLLQSKHTVFSFEVRDAEGRHLDAAALKTVQHRLRRGDGRPDDPTGRRPTRVQTGQPVPLTTGGRAVLRIALGAPLIADYAALPGSDRATEITDDLEFVATWLSTVTR